MEMPISVYQGEIFKEIIVFPDKIVLRKGKGKNINAIEKEMGLPSREIEIPTSEIGCFGKRKCEDIECRYYINCPNLNNCTLNVDKEFTLSEIGEVFGICKERVRQIIDGQDGKGHHQQKGAIKKYAKIFKKLTGTKSIRDILPELPVHFQPLLNNNGK